ncbi:tyrosine-type recombinase/integrase [Asanoa sp. NPDC050611]|uniref:tyrosine-type recombinase/integrase n=1 Tax=Asanoa sp. NPDC050611 TaxID=3157098 RepID=UPI0033D38488
MASLVIPEVGRLVETGDQWEPYRLVDAAGERVDPARAIMAELQAAGRSPKTLRAYGHDLLLWWRFLAAVDVAWDRATRIEARDFARWMQTADKPTRVHWRRKGAGEEPAATLSSRSAETVTINAVTGKASPGRKYAASTRAHCETVLRTFYDFQLEAGTGPLMNPFPMDRGRRAGRANAHHNPMEPFKKERRGRYRPRTAQRIPKSIPDEKFNQLFAGLRSNRDRALLAFWVSTAARASELLGVAQRHVDPGQQLIGVTRKGLGEFQELPASPDAFVWLRLYQEEVWRLGVPRGTKEPLWWTLRRPWRPLSYHAARAMFVRANELLGSNWSLHDLRHTAAYRMARDPGMPLTDVQWILGHRHLSTTEIYTTPTSEDVITNVRAFHARQAGASARPSAPSPAAGYNQESLDVLFRRPAMTAQTATVVHPAAPTQHRYGSLAGSAGKALQRQFTARNAGTHWPATAQRTEAVIARFDEPALRAANLPTQGIRRRSADKVLRWLEGFPGTTWQERWYAGPAHKLGNDWTDELVAWLTAREEFADHRHLRAGLLALFCADVVRPDMEWLVTVNRSRHWRHAMAVHRDPEGFARLQAATDEQLWNSSQGMWARNQIAVILIAKGGTVADITVGDCLQLCDVESKVLAGSSGRTFYYSLLRGLGGFPDESPHTLRALEKRSGQVSVEELIDRYSVENGQVRDLFVDYLSERQPVLDYGSLEELSRNLALHFWKNVEAIEPGITSLHLKPATAKALKERLRVKVLRRRLPNGTTGDVTAPRGDGSYIKILVSIRAFYLDLAQCALEDPSRWGPWAVPCPIGAAEISNKKNLARTKARMDQRTRERLPVLPTLIRAAERNLKEARERLGAVREAKGGQSFSVLGEVYRKGVSADRGNPDSSCIAFDSSERRIDLAQAEHRAFWGWAAVEFLRNTGVRIEEMLEASHHSITQFKVPSTNELVPLLQIAPSKTDQERLLVVSPELADVLSAVIGRLRALSVNGESRRISSGTIRRCLNEILLYSGLVDVAGQPLHFQPHDFRRIFATEAILNGMPPHIAQLVLGHKDINTTMGYKAVYSQEVIEGHRAFISRRRELRPSEEYRSPTDAEWEEFLGHFERRKVSLGDCGRAYGMDCVHEHSCVKCPLLRVDPAQKARLTEICDNLIARIEEAVREGWRGEAEGLRVSLAAADEKLAQLEARTQRASVTNLGIPSFHEIAGRSATLPRGAPTC